MIAKTLLTSVIMLVFGPWGVLTTETAQRDEFRERDEINQTYELPPGARVEVSIIRGAVDITNSDTTAAQVQIIRTARTRADLEYHKIEVNRAGNSLVVRGIQEPEQRQRQNIQVNHHVILKLPRRIDLSVSTISGPVKVGDVEGLMSLSSIGGPAKIGSVVGKLHVNSISGSLTVGNVAQDARVNSISGTVNIGNVGGEARVTSISGNLGLGQVNGAIDVSSVSGGVNVTLDDLSPQGVHINSVSGSVEIGFKTQVNADFNAEHVTGQVYIDVPNVTRDTDAKSSNVRARIGAGGTPITISSVSGNIRLTRT